MCSEHTYRTLNDIINDISAIDSDTVESKKRTKAVKRARSVLSNATDRVFHPNMIDRSFRARDMTFDQGPRGWWMSEICAVSFDAVRAMRNESDLKNLISKMFRQRNVVITLDWFLCTNSSRNNETRACLVRYDSNNNIACVLLTGARVTINSKASPVYAAHIILLCELLHRHVRFDVCDRLFETTAIHNGCLYECGMSKIDIEGWIKLKSHGASRRGVAMVRRRDGRRYGPIRMLHWTETLLRTIVYQKDT